MKDFVKSYLGHLSGYVVAGATIVAGLDPKLVPPQYSFITALAGLVVMVGHHGYSAGIANGVVTAAAQAASKALTSTIPTLVLAASFVLVGAATVSLTGCATMQKVFSPNATPYVTAAVDVAVATAESKGVPAAKINSIAKQALAADTGAGASLAAVMALVNAEVAKLNLPAADLAAVQILEVALTSAVQQQIGQNPNVAVAQADVAQLLNAVIAATGG
jgi:hypothetical protein